MCGWQFAKRFAYLLSIRNWILILFLSSSTSDTDQHNSLLRAVFVGLWHGFAAVRGNTGNTPFVMESSSELEYFLGLYWGVLVSAKTAFCWANNTWSS